MTDYTKYLDKDGLKGMCIGISHANEKERYPQEHIDLLSATLKALEDAGAILIDVDMPSCDREKSMAIMLYEFKQCLNAYLASCDDPGARTLKEIIDFNNDDPERCLKYGQSILLDARHSTGGRLTEPKYIEARTSILRESRALADRLFKENNLDCICHLGWNNIAPSSGYPAINVPIGRGEQTGQPIGLNFFGPAFSEPVLFRAAYAFEQRFCGRVAPEF